MALKCCSEENGKAIIHYCYYCVFLGYNTSGQNLFVFILKFLLNIEEV